MDVSPLMANLKRVYVTHRDRTPAQWRQQQKQMCMQATKR